MIQIVKGSVVQLLYHIDIIQICGQLSYCRGLLRALNREEDQEWEEAAEVIFVIIVIILTEKSSHFYEHMNLLNYLDPSEQVGKADVLCDQAYPDCPQQEWLQIIKKEENFIRR